MLQLGVRFGAFTKLIKERCGLFLRFSFFGGVYRLMDGIGGDILTELAVRIMIVRSSPLGLWEYW